MVVVAKGLRKRKRKKMLVEKRRSWEEIFVFVLVRNSTRRE